jgi:hypothetical protein
MINLLSSCTWKKIESLEGTSGNEVGDSFGIGNEFPTMGTGTHGDKWMVLFLSQQSAVHQDRSCDWGQTF